MYIYLHICTLDFSIYMTVHMRSFDNSNEGLSKSQLHRMFTWLIIVDLVCYPLKHWWDFRNKPKQESLNTPLYDLLLSVIYNNGYNRKTNTLSISIVTANCPFLNCYILSIYWLYVFLLLVEVHAFSLWRRLLISSVFAVTYASLSWTIINIEH